MKKLSFILFVAFFTFIIVPKPFIQAKQFDNLVKLPVDEAQQKELDLISAEELAATGQAVKIDEGGIVLGVQKTSMRHNGPHFRFEDTVVIAEDLRGDVYAGGGTVRVDGRIDGDLLVGGGTVILNGEVTGDVRAGGGNIIINGIIGQNLTVGGGSVVFNSESVVGNSIVAGAGTIDVAGKVVGNIWLGGGATKLAGNFDGDVNVQADALEIAPGVMVGGSLRTETAQEAKVADDLQVAGEKNLTLMPEVSKNQARPEKISSVGGFLVKASLISFLMSFSIGLVSGSILLYLVGKLASGLAEKVSENPLANMGWGLAFLILTPIGILFTMTTLVALPIAFMMMGAYVLSICLSKWVVALAVGQKLESKFKIKFLKNKYLSFAAGLLVLNLIYSLPLIGGIVQLVAFLLGLGVIFGLIKQTFFSKKKTSN